MITQKHLIIATRGSNLALWQANHVKNLLQELEPSLRISLNIIKTTGDKILDTPLARIGGKGLFVKEIEDAILEGRADLAVHSVKDVPMLLPQSLILGCILPRGDDTDAYVSCTYPAFQLLPPNSIVGTSSLRRKAQILALRPDLKVENLRGNVDTRLKKLEAGDYDAIILASAALERLELNPPFMQRLERDIFVPAIAQGALGIECHEDNYDVLVLLSSLEDRNTRICVEAERSFLRRLDGGCQVPIGGFAELTGENLLKLTGMVAECDGMHVIKDCEYGDASEAEQTGSRLAERMLANGALDILEKLYSCTSK